MSEQSNNPFNHIWTSPLYRYKCGQTGRQTSNRVRRAMTGSAKAQALSMASVVVVLVNIKVGTLSLCCD